MQADYNLQRSKPQLGTNTYFYFAEITKKMIEAVHKEAVKLLKKKGDIIEATVLYDAIHLSLFAQFGNITNVMLDSIMDIFLDIVKGEEIYV
jgi:hypothetical protein